MWLGDQGTTASSQSHHTSGAKLEISSPYNPVHLTHVGYNSETGEFTVRQECISGLALTSLTLRDATGPSKRVGTAPRGLWNLKARSAVTPSGRD